jgi:hypothetical protein
MDADGDEEGADAIAIIVDAITNIEVSPSAPPVTSVPLPNNTPADQPLMGSSRTSGGFSRGRSHGNVPNHADLTTTFLDVQIPSKGEVSLYMTDQYPRSLKFEELKGESELVVMVKVVRSMAPILEMVARKFPDIQSECI